MPPCLMNKPTMNKVTNKERIKKKTKKKDTHLYKFNRRIGIVKKCKSEGTQVHRIAFVRLTVATR